MEAQIVIFIMSSTLLYAFLLIPSISGQGSVDTELNGAGASFPAEVYLTWMAAYKAKRSQFVQLGMKYEAKGSGNGKARIKNEAGPPVAYAGSDSLLKEEDYTHYPDLQMFPSMAGPLVLAYNLPGITDLILTRQLVVWIYDGTVRWWNDTAFTVVNPNISFPNEPIVPVAREDKSGSTEIFTSALSSFDNNWKTTYGIFSTGSNSDGQPYDWNDTVVKKYGNRVYGVTDAVAGTKYAIGYTSLLEATNNRLPYAYIINKSGKVVKASSASVQAAMDVLASNMSSRLTSVLVDAASPEAYPLSGYTYIILRLHTMTDCNSAVELVRYAEWFLFNEQARFECEQLKMVPVSSTIAARIREDVLKQMTCDGANVYEAMQRQMDDELASLQNWRLPVAITVPLALLIIAGLTGYLLVQRIKMNRMIDRDEWKIPVNELNIYVPKDGEGNSRVRKLLWGKRGPSPSNTFGSVRVIADLQWPGKWKDKMVGLRAFNTPPTITIDRPTKRAMLEARDLVNNENVLRFYGITYLDNSKYIVRGYCSKGNLDNIIHDPKFDLTNELRISVALDVAQGMTYLHGRGLIHGRLRPECCLIDNRWTIKIADWEMHRLNTLFAQLDKEWEKQIALDELQEFQLEMSDNRKTNLRIFYLAPEIIRSNYACAPTKAADAFSFAIMLQELFSRQYPYSEYGDGKTTKDIVYSICNENLRPKEFGDMTNSLRILVNTSWSIVPGQRPSFDQILKNLRHILPSNLTVLDSMVATMETYTERLEKQIAMNNLNINMLEMAVQRAIPSPIYHAYKETMTCVHKEYTSVYVLLVQFVNMDELIMAGHPEVLLALGKIFNMLYNKAASHHLTVHDVTTGRDYLLLPSSMDAPVLQQVNIIADFAVQFQANIKSFTHHGGSPKADIRLAVLSGQLAITVLAGSVPKLILTGDVVRKAHAPINENGVGVTEIPGTLKTALVELGFLTQKTQSTENTCLLIGKQTRSLEENQEDSGLPAVNM